MVEPWNQGYRPPNTEKNLGCIPDILTYKNNMSAGPLTPQQLNPDSLHPHPILLLNNPSRQHSKALYHWGVRRRERTGKHGKVGVKRKRQVLVQLSFSLQGNGRQSLRLETGGQPHPMWWRTQGPSIVKGWEIRETTGAFRYIHIKQHQNPQTIEPNVSLIKDLYNTGRGRGEEVGGRKDK